MSTNNAFKFSQGWRNLTWWQSRINKEPWNDKQKALAMRSKSQRICTIATSMNPSSVESFILACVFRSLHAIKIEFSWRWQLYATVPITCHSDVTAVHSAVNLSVAAAWPRWPLNSPSTEHWSVTLLDAATLLAVRLVAPSDVCLQQQSWNSKDSNISLTFKIKRTLNSFWKTLSHVRLLIQLILIHFPVNRFCKIPMSTHEQQCHANAVRLIYTEPDQVKRPASCLIIEGSTTGYLMTQ